MMMMTTVVTEVVMGLFLLPIFNLNQLGKKTLQSSHSFNKQAYVSFNITMLLVLKEVMSDRQDFTIKMWLLTKGRHYTAYSVRTRKDSRF